MVDIQPYEFKKKTNIKEHNDIVDKVNEIVGVINDTQMDTINTRLTAVEGDVTALETEVSGLDNELATKADKSEIPNVSNFITADALTPYAKTVDVDNTDVTGVDATINNGEITIKLTRPDGDMSDSIDCPFIQTATLIPTSTARAFKIRFTYTNGTQYDTNEFVIPEGGGTDVSVTGVTVGDGTAPNSFKVTIQLSDASTINSNDYVIEFPENTDTYPTNLTATLSGTTLNMTIGLNNSSTVKGTADLSGLLTNYATESYVDTQVATKLDKTTADGYYQPKGNYLTSVPIGGTTIGGVKNGGNVTINADGTMNTTDSLPLSIKTITSVSNIAELSNIPQNSIILCNMRVTGSPEKSGIVIGIFLKDYEGSPWLLKGSGEFQYTEGFPTKFIKNIYFTNPGFLVRLTDGDELSYEDNEITLLKLVAFSF